MKIELWDSANRNYNGEIDSEGQVNIFGNDLFIYGTLIDGKFELFDKSGEYYWGNLKDGRTVEIWKRSDSSFIFGQTSY